MMAAAVVGRSRDGIAIPAWRTQRGRPGVEHDRLGIAFESVTHLRHHPEVAEVSKRL